MCLGGRVLCVGCVLYVGHVCDMCYIVWCVMCGVHVMYVV